VQGLTTCDLAKKNNTAGLFLNPKGRVIYDAIFTKDENLLCIECDSSVSGNLLNHIKKYKLRSKVDLSLGREMRVYALLGDFKKIYELFYGQHNIVIHRDPRNDALGYRIYGIFNNAEEREKFEQRLRAVNEISFDNSNLYARLRVIAGIPEGPVDFVPENTLPLEQNYDLLGGIDFEKGCYIGQELTARTHHTGVIRKRLLPVYSENGELPLPGTEFPGKMGEMRTSLGDIGLASVRLEKIEELASTSNIHTVEPDWISSANIK
jgi:folate-binding protein YgfZ